MPEPNPFHPFVKEVEYMPNISNTQARNLINKVTTQHTVLRQEWECDHPVFRKQYYGYSLHLTMNDLGAFRSRLAHNVMERSCQLPQPDGEPIQERIDEKTYQAVLGSEYGIMYEY